jgi:phosphoglycolate phosphatase-like HAD superfamily hydrolase
MNAGIHSYDLATLPRLHDSFVGIDSDGCVFDTMEVKQKQCFHPEIIRTWGLQAIATQVREAAEFVNLYSRGRGRNRFLSLVETMDRLRTRADVMSAGVPIPKLNPLRQVMASGVVLGNPALEAAVAISADPELKTILDWSLQVNRQIEAISEPMPPFKGVAESLARISGHSDAIVVSQTPCEALDREWAAAGLDQQVLYIAGQEHGTKTEHLRLATEGKYTSRRVLMIGDAPGDCVAARDNGVLFYPINPSQEEQSWERFHREAYNRFLAGTYAGVYEDELVAAFDSMLPAEPDW